MNATSDGADSRSSGTPWSIATDLRLRGTRHHEERRVFLGGVGQNKVYRKEKEKGKG